MKPFRSFLLLLLALTLALGGCRPRATFDVDDVMRMAQEAPDSALTMLRAIPRQRLAPEDLAHFCLAYSWAQDRSGLDVADDSLLRVAYDYYRDREELPYYARCMYYMGKYYFWVDSMEQAIHCLNAASLSACNRQDTLTECLALEKIAKCLWMIDKERAEKLALRCDSLYSALPNGEIRNKIYYKNEAASCAAHNGHFNVALKYGNDALRLAFELNDTTVLRNILRDLSVAFSLCEKNDEALIFSKTAYSLAQPQTANTFLYALSWNYLRADSLIQAKDILEKILPKTSEEIFVKYYRLMCIGIRELNAKEAEDNANEAFSQIEEMYKAELNGKIKYYDNLQKAEHEKAQADLRSARRGQWIAFILTAAAGIILLLIYKGHTDRRQRKAEADRAAQERRHEQSLHEQETRLIEQAHREALAQRDQRIQMMRDFLTEKSQTIRKLDTNQEQHIALSADDWDEIGIFLEAADDHFVSRLRAAFPHLDEKDVRLLMLLRLGLPTKTLSAVYCLSERTIKQKLYDLKSRLGLTDRERSARAFIEQF